jgi:hypothetical protein
MPFADPNETFDYGLLRTSANYVSDDGNTYKIQLRKAYAVASGLVFPATAAALLPFRRKPRVVFLEKVQNNGRKIRRKMPCSAAVLAALETTNNATVAVDGITFKVMGFDGESQHYDNTLYYQAP